VSPVDEPLDDTSSASQENLPRKRRDRGSLRRVFSSPTDEDQEATPDKSSVRPSMGKNAGYAPRQLRVGTFRKTLNPKIGSPWLCEIIALRKRYKESQPPGRLRAQNSSPGYATRMHRVQTSI
jgi:hypothetical protein